MIWPRVRNFVTSAGLRVRLAFLALLNMIPLVGLLLVGALNSRSDVLEAARHRALEYAELGAGQQQNVLDEAKTLLTVLSKLSAITEAEPEKCRDLLMQTLGDHPHMAEFALIDPQGQIVCTNRSVRPHLNVLSRPYVRRLLMPGADGFDTSDLTISKTSGISTVFIGLSLPSKSGTSQPSGVLVAGLNLSWLSSLAAEAAKGSGDVAVLLHLPDGVVLAGYPEGAMTTGQRISDSPVVSSYNRTSKDKGTVEGKDRDGTERIYGFAPLPGTAGVVLAIGLNRAEVLSLANNRMAVALGVALTAMLVAVVIAWIAAWRMIIHPIGGIMETAHRLGSSDLKARVAMASWHAPELQLLASTLNIMADDFATSQAQLAESEAGFRLLSENAGDMVVRVGPDGVPVYVSPAGARIFGLPTDALTKVNLTDLMHPDDQAQAKAVQARLLCGVIEEAEFSYCVPHSDGGTVWVESTLRTVRDPGTGALDGYMAVVRDVTARHQVELERAARADDMQEANTRLERLARHLAQARDRAERESRAKSRFLAGMSHELRTPLNGILGYTHLLRLEGGLNETQTARIECMLSAGSHLLQMINCVLDLSEIEADQVKLQMGAVDLRAVAEACLDLVRPMADAKKLVLRFAVAPDLDCTVTSDATRLRQILLNLLGNAAKFTNQGWVELRLLAAGSMFRFEIADTGPGIPAEQQHRLFQDFERLQIDDGSKVEGAGLGLAITSRIATLMGGHIGYDSNPDGGSVFWIELPAVIESAAPATELVPQDEAPPLVLHILVVDDVAMNRDIAGSFLTAAGHGVMFAEDGAAAVDLATANDFDVILMDVRMPVMDGLEATRRIRCIDGARALVPIVALTAQTFADQIMACTEAGMGSHLAKPFAPKILLDAVLSAFRSTPQRSAALTAEAGNSPAKQLREIGADLPTINSDVFERTCAFLEPDVAVSHLETIADRVELMIRKLRASDLTLDRDELAETTHALSGSAGMFGFERVSTLGRSFEHAVQVGATNAPALANSLRVALEDVLVELRDRIPALA